MRWGWVFLGAIGGAGLVVGFLAYSRAKDWQRRAQQARMALETRGGDIELALTSSGEKFSRELADEGRRLAENAARAEAERVIGLEYGLTQERLAAVARLGQRLGV